MKKIFTFIFISLVFSAISFADNEIKSSILSSGPYAGLQIGVAIPDDLALYAGPSFGAEVGYTFPRHFRLEEAFNYFQQNLVAQNYYIVNNNDYGTTALMTNAYYDFDTHTALIPYVGFGLGWLHARLGTYDASFSPSCYDSFAYQGIVGLSYYFSRKISLDTQYRYLGGFVSNNSIIEAGLNYHF